MPAETQRYVAFAGSRRIAAGTLRAVVRAGCTHGDEPVRIFSADSGEEVQIDLSGTPDEVVARLPPERTDVAPPETTDADRGPGRPKLGVVAKEVTLLPRHWAWLAAQRGSVSATLRRLIDEARHTHEARDAVRRAQDSAYRFTSAMAASEPTFEEAVRALYRADLVAFDLQTAAWPPDVRDCTRRLAAAAFQSDSMPNERPDGR
jgi:hypothetical protein